jgi:hypothetical protein
MTSRAPCDREPQPSRPWKRSLSRGPGGTGGWARCAALKSTPNGRESFRLKLIRAGLQGVRPVRPVLPSYKSQTLRGYFAIGCLGPWPREGV